MLWTVTNHNMSCGSNVLDVNAFECLTGRSLNWEARNGKQISVQRSKGKIHIYDPMFIPGERYRRGRKRYICIYVDKRGEAIMVPINGSILQAEIATSTSDWEVIYLRCKVL